MGQLTYYSFLTNSSSILDFTVSSTHTVPEFSAWTILPLFAVIILISTVFIRKRIPKIASFFEK